MSPEATTLFEQLDGVLESSAHSIRDAVISQYRDFPWVDYQYQALQPLIRRELDDLLFHILGTFDNVGSVLPTDAPVLGYTINALSGEETLDKSLAEIRRLDKVDIRDENTDYQEMWQEYRKSKLSNDGLTDSQSI